MHKGSDLPLHRGRKPSFLSEFRAPVGCQRRQPDLNGLLLSREESLLRHIFPGDQLTPWNLLLHRFVILLDHLRRLRVDELGVCPRSNGSVREAGLDLGPLANGEEPAESEEPNDCEMVGDVPRTLGGY